MQNHCMTAARELVNRLNNTAHAKHILLNAKLWWHKGKYLTISYIWKWLIRVTAKVYLKPACIHLFAVYLLHQFFARKFDAQMTFWPRIEWRLRGALMRMSLKSQISHAHALQESSELTRRAYIYTSLFTITVAENKKSKRLNKSQQCGTKQLNYKHSRIIRGAHAQLIIARGCWRCDVPTFKPRDAADKN